MKKTVIAIAAAGFALSGTAGMLSAQAAPAHSAGASARVGKSSCVRTVMTMTNLVLAKHTMRTGTANLITVHVRSMAGPAHPAGSVAISFDQTQSGFGFEKTLTDGVATAHVPRSTRPGKYDVQAAYVPAACSRYKRSTSSVEHLTITR
jgi:hypothetical protein